MKTNKDIRNDKIDTVISWLTAREGFSTTIRCWRGAIVVSEAFTEFGGHLQHDLYIWSESEVAQWHDRAARLMIKHGRTFDAAMDESWPNSTAGCVQP